MVTVAPPFSKQEAAAVAQALQEHYYREIPAPKFVVIDLKSVQRVDPVSDSRYRAVVTLETEYIPRKPKKHTVNLTVRFNEHRKITGIDFQ